LNSHTPYGRSLSFEDVEGYFKQGISHGHLVYFGIHGQ
jgi:hypothetical protein